MCIRNDVSHCSLRGNIPPPLQKVGKTAGVILCGQILSLHAAATISGHNLWLDVVKHQLPIVYYIFQYITVKDIGW